MTANGQGFMLCWYSVLCQSTTKADWKTEVEVMQKADSNSSARTGADSEQKDEDIFVCQHSSKSHVVRSCYVRELIVWMNRP